MKRASSWRKILFFCLLAAVMSSLFLGGCSFGKDKGGKGKDLDFTVVGESEIPAELMKIIAEKQASPFKLTYSDDQSLYIVVGYGRQETGGFSIAVEELYATDNSIVLNTELIGPEKGEKAGTEASNPYIVIKTAYSDAPVVFQ